MYTIMSPHGTCQVYESKARAVELVNEILLTPEVKEQNNMVSLTREEQISPTERVAHVAFFWWQDGLIVKRFRDYQVSPV